MKAFLMAVMIVAVHTDNENQFHFMV